MALIYLANQYDLVVGDKFELFYTGIIKSMNPYKYYIKITCDKGYAYPRYYTITPKEKDAGKHKLTVELFDDEHNLIEHAETILNIVNPVNLKRNQTILCIGDSLTFNGVWVEEGYRRITKADGEPKGLGFTDACQMIGTCKRGEVGFEGYGGWKWQSYCEKDSVDASAGIWIETKHNFKDNMQESIWDIMGFKWEMETILKDKIKFKRAPGNYYCGSVINGDITYVAGGGESFNYTISDYTYYFEKSNPFYFKEINDLSFKKYLEKNKFNNPAFIYFLLTWNGQWIPYNNDFSNHEPYIKRLVNKIHEELPNCKIRFISIQLPSLNGGITSTYGCNGPYSDTFGELVTCMNYCKYLEDFTKRNEYKDFMKYIDLKAQFDVEYSIPATFVKVNARSNTLERLGNNGVHPTMEGYLQIGDCFYRALVADLTCKD